MYEIQRLLPAISILVDRDRVMDLSGSLSMSSINIGVTLVMISFFLNDDHVGYGNFRNTPNT
jgi:hypothetical protein